MCNLKTENKTVLPNPYKENKAACDLSKIFLYKLRTKLNIYILIGSNVTPGSCHSLGIINFMKDCYENCNKISMDIIE